MTYTELLHALWLAGYMRVERDDRLLDMFPNEDREKGVELWEKWDSDEVRILRVKLPYSVKHLKLFSVPKTKIEAGLAANALQELSDYTPLAFGATVSEKL